MGSDILEASASGVAGDERCFARKCCEGHVLMGEGSVARNFEFREAWVARVWER
jgi:hypothetical protein